MCGYVAEVKVGRQSAADIGVRLVALLPITRQALVEEASEGVVSGGRATPGLEPFY
jgi:hypothetical protein